jgi:hypothetical protein
VLEDDAIRAEITRTAAQATAATLGLPVEQVQATAESVLSTAAGAEVMRQLIADAHAKLIGAREEPVQITTAQLVQLTLNEQVGGLPPIELPVEEVAVLDTIRRALGWAVPIAAAIGAVALLLGLIAHPRKADAVFGIGMFCIIAGVLTIVLGYVVPVHLFPALTDNVWAPAIPAIAEYALPLVIVVSVVLVAVGLALMIGAASARRRKLWSSPVTINRYGDQHRWS